SQRFGVECHPASCSPAGRWSIAATTSLRQYPNMIRRHSALLSQARTVSIRARNRFIIVVPFLSLRTDRYRKLRSVLIVVSPSRLPYFIIEAINRLIDIYFNEFLQEQKTRHLDLLRRNVEAFQTASPPTEYWRLLDVTTNIAKFFKHASEPAVQL